MYRMNKLSAKAGVAALVSLLCLLVATGCDGASTEKPARSDIEREQSKLLSLAFDTATAIPLEPHHKDRARAQEGVAMACIQVDQPARAAEYARKIGNWRRGVAMGELAFHMASQGEKGLAESYLEDASRVAAHEKGWRKDRIRVRIARTRTLLGQLDQAREQMGTAEDLEKPRLVSAAEEKLSDEQFDAKLKELNGWVAKGDYDITRAAVDSMVEILEREYSTASRRKQLVSAITEACRKMPVFVRVDMLLRMVSIGVEHGDRGGAMDLVNQAQEYVDGATWPMRHGMKVKARVAGARFLAGDEKRARRDLDALLDEYRKERQKIVNIYRAESLRPLAEAYQAMGDRSAALEVYKLAVEEGVVNPNSRPRAIDLSATCCSMAVHGVIPDAELWARMQEIRGGLSDPW